MNICFLSYDYPSATGGGGVGNQVRILGQALAKAGHRVTVVALAHADTPPFQEDESIRVFRVEPGGLHWYVSKLPVVGELATLALREVEYAWAGYRLVQRLHRQEAFDLIEGTETGALGVALLMPAVPLVIRLHGEKYTFHKYTPDLPLTPGLCLSRLLQRMALRRARILISPSAAHAREISAELGGKHPPIQVIPNCVDLEQLRRTPQTPRHPATVLFAGRVERGKGVMLLLKAATQVVGMETDARFLLAGAFQAPFTPSALDAYLRERGLQEHVQFLGHIPWTDLLQLYRQATLCVLPSYYETFGIAAIEPMALGCPVVVTAGGALPEIVEDGVTGVVTPVGDATALAGAILRLLADEPLRARLSAAGMERASSRWSVDRLLQPNLRLYQRLAPRQSAQPPAGDRVQRIFFSPHLDDAVLSCGGEIAALGQAGDAVCVVTVFAGIPSAHSSSAFVSHLQAKWCLPNSAVEERRREDLNALRSLGVSDVEQWDFCEAPYRTDGEGRYLYASYTELTGARASDDGWLADALSQRIHQRIANYPQNSTVLYFPLGLGKHVDHTFLYQIGRHFQKSGYEVHFYEEWPYVEQYAAVATPKDWWSETVEINLTRKIAAAAHYRSQILGLGGSLSGLTQRLTTHAHRVGGAQPLERYWRLHPGTPEDTSEPDCPLQPMTSPLALRDFRQWLDTFRWHPLAELLPAGQGICLDVGCGDGRLRGTIEDKGFRWVGMDMRAAQTGEQFQADAEMIPAANACAAAVVVWQVMEYLAHPERTVSESARILAPGGVFCGSVSFLEPVHGRTRYNISPLALEELLRGHGFVDIQIQPGLNGFALLLWTWLNRWLGQIGAQIALPLAAGLLVPLAALRFLPSWLWQRFGRGSGYGAGWIANVAPLEFAGHLLFTARKPARESACISAT